MSTEEKYSCIEKRTSIREYIRNREKFSPPKGYSFYCFMYNGVEYSGIDKYVENDRAFVTQLWPYGTRVIPYKSNITVVYKRIPKGTRTGKMESIEELFNRLAPKQYSNLAGRYDITRDR